MSEGIDEKEKQAKLSALDEIIRNAENEQVKLESVSLPLARAGGPKAVRGVKKQIEDAQFRATNAMMRRAEIEADGDEEKVREILRRNVREACREAEVGLAMLDASDTPFKN